MRGQVLFDGEAHGEALVLREPLSLWGGLDPETGVLIDAHHPQRGAVLTDRVVVMPSGRVSSSSSSVLAEAIRTGHAPAAILLGEPDLILAVGAAVGHELYERRIPILNLEAADLAGIRDGAALRIGEGGEVEIA
jgi:predicted aconitase with swiveling domain